MLNDSKAGFTDWQCSYALTTGIEDCVTHSGCQWRQCWFAGAGRAVPRVNDFDMHTRTLRHAEQRILVIVALDDRTIFDGNSLCSHGAETIHDRSLQLIFKPREIDDLSHIGCHPYIVYRDAFTFNAYLSNLSDVATMAQEKCQS